MAGLLLLAILIGCLLPVQAGVNAQLRGALGDPVATAFVSFLVGAVGLLLIALCLRISMPVGAAWSRSTWWLWTGGLLGAAYIVGMVVLAPRLGAATLIAAVVAGQMVASLVVDHFGWVGFAAHPVSLMRLLGAGLVIAGVMLIQR